MQILFKQHQLQLQEKWSSQVKVLNLPSMGLAEIRRHKKTQKGKNNTTRAKAAKKNRVENSTGPRLLTTRLVSPACFHPPCVQLPLPSNILPSFSWPFLKRKYLVSH